MGRRVHPMKMDVPHNCRRTRDKEKNIAATSNTGGRYAFAILWSPLWGDCNSSAAGDTVQATSCPATFITFIKAFNSAECCALMKKTQNRWLMCSRTHRYSCAHSSTHQSDNCLLMMLFVEFIPTFISIVWSVSDILSRRQVSGKGASVMRIHKRTEPALILETCHVAGRRLGPSMLKWYQRIGTAP